MNQICKKFTKCTKYYVKIYVTTTIFFCFNNYVMKGQIQRILSQSEFVKEKEQKHTVEKFSFLPAKKHRINNTELAIRISCA